LCFPDNDVVVLSLICCRQLLAPARGSRPARLHTVGEIIQWS